MAVLIQRRLPANKLYTMANPEITYRMEKNNQKPIIYQPKDTFSIISSEPKPDPNNIESTIKENDNTSNNISNQLKCVKYTCCCLCCCTACTTTIGLVIALCHEWLN